MPLYEINGNRPVVGEGTWVAPSAEIVGAVAIGRNCYIGFGAVIRGDFGPISIGDRTLVEENVVIHTATRTRIGSGVIIGHLAMLHDAVIEDEVLVGMQAMISEYATIGRGAIVAEHSRVPKNFVVPADTLMGGAPACKIGMVQEHHRTRMTAGRQAYQDLIRQYRQTFKVVSE